MSSSSPGGAGARWEGDAPAKVNLVLRVLAREESGYHQIETVFQALELADRVTLELRGEDRVELEVTGVDPGELGPDQENLAVRAARRFLAAVGEGGAAGSAALGVQIHLQKRIPHGAGLGGGSSDAAAVLRGLNELHGDALTRDQLLRIGGVLGADVPFFLTGASRALAWNRGDRLLPLSPLPVREVLVAVPRVGMATPEAYRRLAAHREETGARVAAPGLVEVGAPWEGEGAGPPEAGAFHTAGSWSQVAREAMNDFEAALFPVRPELAALKGALQELGARPALLAGSGAAVFGVFGGGRGEGTPAERALEARFSETSFLWTKTKTRTRTRTRARGSG